MNSVDQLRQDRERRLLNQRALPFSDSTAHAMQGASFAPPPAASQEPRTSTGAMNQSANEVQDEGVASVVASDGSKWEQSAPVRAIPAVDVYRDQSKKPVVAGLSVDGRGWVRTSGLPRVRRALSH